MPAAQLNRERITRIARLLQGIPDLPVLDYAGNLFPPPGASGALEYFFGIVLHQFGFWTDDGRRYAAPMLARIEGRTLKGSDFVWKAGARAAEREPDFFDPAFQAVISPRTFAAAFAEDAGTCPLPMFDAHVALSRSYGRDLLAQGLSPRGIVESVNAEDRPLNALLKVLSGVGGYREDPLRKKALLLALALERRPERFLRVKDPLSWAPVVDYHNIRTALRTGMVEPVGEPLRGKLRRREFVTEEEERAVRAATFDAIAGLIEGSGAGVAKIDALFFGARRTCPEMTAPDCPRCPLEKACAKRTELFQPVFRTTFY